MKYFYIALSLVCIALITGCQTTDSDRIDTPLPEIDYNYSDMYVLDTSDLVESEEGPNFIFMVIDEASGLRTAGAEEAPTHVVMLQEDLNKIDAMLVIKTAYKDISHNQAALLNIERDKSNALIDMLKMERQSRILERQLRLDIEHLYKAERKEHRFDNILNRVTMVVAVIGGIALCAL